MSDSQWPETLPEAVRAFREMFASAGSTTPPDSYFGLSPKAEIEGGRPNLKSEEDHDNPQMVRTKVRFFSTFKLTCQRHHYLSAHRDWQYQASGWLGDWVRHRAWAHRWFGASGWVGDRVRHWARVTNSAWIPHKSHPRSRKSTCLSDNNRNQHTQIIAKKKREIVPEEIVISQGQRIWGEI